MKRITSAGKILCFTLGASAWLLGTAANALTINDPGVVGSIYTGTQSSNVPNEIDWANYLLGLGANASPTADGNTPLDGATEDYATGVNDYNGTLTGGTQVGPGADLSAFLWVLGKYNGQNAGYVLFYMPDYGTSIPQYPASLWTTNPTQYALSHATGFGKRSVPDGGLTVTLLGLALGGLAYVRRKLA